MTYHSLPCDHAQEQGHTQAHDANPSNPAVGTIQPPEQQGEQSTGAGGSLTGHAVLDIQESAAQWSSSMPRVLASLQGQMGAPLIAVHIIMCRDVTAWARGAFATPQASLQVPGNPTLRRRGGCYC